MMAETTKLPYDTSTHIGPGSAVVIMDNKAQSTPATSFPDYISMSSNRDTDRDTLDLMAVTHNMIFKVEYVGAMPPTVGMSLGISNHKYKMDAVTYNGSGKGQIVALDKENGNFVYMRFRNKN